MAKITMPEQIDVYRDWLGIREADRPLTHYQLLRVPRFCDDVAKIREHYRKMNAHVRKYASGDYATQSQELLGELARAMLALTDAGRKREYDAALGREDSGELRRRSLEEILLGRKVIDQQQLAKARSFADAVGLELREAIVQQKMAAPGVVAVAYAESEGLPFIELADIGVAEDVVPLIPPHLARNNNCVPVMVDEGTLLMGSPYPLSPDVEQELRLRCNMPVRTVICTGSSVHAALGKHFPRDAATPPPTGNAEANSPPPKYVSRDERIRQVGLIGVAGFCVTVIVAMLLMSFFEGGFARLDTGSYAIAIVTALLVGGAATAGAWKWMMGG
jgi:hypothetical protein